MEVWPLRVAEEENMRSRINGTYGVSVAVFAAAVIGVASSPVRTSAQTNGACMDSTSSASQFYRNSYEGVASRTDAASVAFRTSSGIPTLSPSQVRLVADTTVCRAASIAYDAQLQVPHPSEPVIVIELGTKRLVTKNFGTGGRWLNMLFNEDFTVLLKTLGL